MTPPWCGGDRPRRPSRACSATRPMQDLRLRSHAVRPAHARRTTPQAPLASGAVAVHGPPTSTPLTSTARPSRRSRRSFATSSRSTTGVGVAGWPQSGSALLQGLVYCGHCGRKMTVQYQAAARYLCCGHKEQGGGRECQRIPIAPVNAQVVRSFWEALAPAELDRYDAAVAALDDRAGRSDGPATSSSSGCATRPASRRSSIGSSTPRTGWWRPSWSGAGSRRCGPSARPRRNHGSRRWRSNR